MSRHAAGSRCGSRDGRRNTRRGSCREPGSASWARTRSHDIPIVRQRGPRTTRRALAAVRLIVERSGAVQVRAVFQRTDDRIGILVTDHAADDLHRFSHHSMMKMPTIPTAMHATKMNTPTDNATSSPTDISELLTRRDRDRDDHETDCRGEREAWRERAAPLGQECSHGVSSGRSRPTFFAAAGKSCDHRWLHLQMNFPRAGSCTPRSRSSGQRWWASVPVWR